MKRSRLVFCVSVLFLGILFGCGSNHTSDEDTLTVTPMITSEPEAMSVPALTSTVTPVTTPMSTPEPTPEPVVVELPDDIFSFHIAIDNEVYQFPIWATDFENMGWLCDEDDKSVELEPREYTFTTWEKMGIKVSVRLSNFSINTVCYDKCSIAGVNLQLGNMAGHTVTLPKGIVIGSATKEDIITVYGTPVEEYDGKTFYSATYECGNYQYIKLYVYKESGVLEEVDICNMVELDDRYNSVDDSIPDYVANYEAPTSVVDLDYEMIFEIEGDIYKLPCPVSELLKHGFTVDTENSDEYIPSKKRGAGVLVKDGVSVSCKICNYAKYATCFENCFITEISVDQYKDKVNMVMFETVKVGASEDEVLKAISELNYIVKNITGNDRSYIVFAADEGEYGNRYYISCNKGIVNMISLRNDEQPENGEGKPKS